MGVLRLNQSLLVIVEIRARKNTFSRKDLEKNSSNNSDKNMKEDTLRGEGGSDVFSSTRHVNPNATQASNDFKMKFWSNDDSPIIRPLLKTQPHSNTFKPEISMGVNHDQADGYGGIACKKITKISGR